MIENNGKYSIKNTQWHDCSCHYIYIAILFPGRLHFDDDMSENIGGLIAFIGGIAQMPVYFTHF